MKPLKYLILSALYICVLGGNPVYAQRASEEPHVRINLLPERGTIQPGETLSIGIEQNIDPHWHTYWVNPGDSGVAPEISWTLPDGFKTGDIEWPTPRKIPFGPLTNYGYEDHVVLLQSVTAPDNLPSGPVRLSAEVTILVCKDICIPETSTHTLTLNDGSADNSAALKQARNALPRPSGWPASYREESGNLIVTISPANADAFADVQTSTLSLIPHEWGLVENSAAVTAEAKDSMLTLQQKRGDRALSEVSDIRTLLTYTDKNGQHRGISLIATPESNAAAVAVPAPATESPAPENTSLMIALLFALLGGLVLNLMPCVFPVLSLKAISLSKMGEKEQSHAAASGWAYTAGIVLTFALIAGILMALKSAGAQIGWGFQLQNPVVVYALALLLFVIGLNLSGVFTIHGGFTSIGQKLTQQSGLTGAFFTGVLATLVATPCTAPFMGAAMGYALTTSSSIAGIAVFVALGLGLALPYLLLALMPPLRKILPRPGPWMETFKEFLAFPMYASAAWLIWVFAQQTGSMAVLAALLGMIALAFTFWAWNRRPAKQPMRLIITAIIVGTLAAGLTLSFGAALNRTTPQTTTANDGMWEAFSQNRLDELLQGNDGVFVDMTAAWCITCKVNERIALNIPETRTLFADKNIRALQGDWTNQNPEITKFLESHGRKGVPLYVFYGPRDPATGNRPAPEVLPQILTPAIVADAVQ